MKALLVSLACALLVSCGGGGSSATQSPATYTTKLEIRRSTGSPLPTVAGYNAYVTMPSVSGPAASVQDQATNSPGNVMIMVGAAKDAVLADLDQYLAAAVNFVNIKWVYVYDEIGFEQGGVDFSKVPATIAAAHKVRASGLKATVSILPEVIMRPEFAANVDVNAFDVIGIDVYPSGGLDWNMNGCTYNNNKYTTALKCSVDKLRAMGYKGEIWYIYQAFGSQTDANLVAEFAAQRETVAQAPSFGVVGLVPYGYDKAAFGSLGYPLYPGQGSSIEPLLPN